MSDSSSTASMSSVNVDEEYDDEWDKDDSEPLEINGPTLIAYVIGGLTVFLGYRTLFVSGRFSGFFFLFAGLFALPVVRDGIEKAINIRFDRWSTVLICFVVYSIGAWIYANTPAYG